MKIKIKSCQHGNQPEVLFLVTVQLGEKCLLAVSVAARGEYFDQGSDHVVSSHTVSLAGVHLLLVGVAQVGLQAPGSHEQTDLQAFVAEYVLVIPVHLVTHLRPEAQLGVL